MYHVFMYGLNQILILLCYKIKYSKTIITGNRVLFKPLPPKPVILSCLHGEIIM